MAGKPLVDRLDFSGWRETTLLLTTMKHILITITILLTALSLAEDPKVTREPTPTATELVEMGIDAGINSCIVQGSPRNKLSLELVKARSKACVLALYPEFKWTWKNPQPIDPKDFPAPEGENVF